MYSRLRVRRSEPRLNSLAVRDCVVPRPNQYACLTFCEYLRMSIKRPVTESSSGNNGTTSCVQAIGGPSLAWFELL